jgi:hypothetical protein
MRELEELKRGAPEPYLAEIRRLLEEIRYAPNDLAGSISLENAQISSLIRDDLAASCRSKNLTAFQEAVSKIDQLIQSRYARLTASRSKV